MMRNSFLLLLLLLIGGSYTHVRAQDYNSPFTLYGLGELQSDNFARHQAMGGTSIGYRDVRAFAPINPASYSAVGFTTFQAGVNAMRRRIYNESGSNVSDNGSLDYLALGFPLSRKLKWGASVGLLPFSSIGYQLEFKQAGVTPPQSEIFEGNGSLSKFYFGTGIELVKGLSVGVNAAYLFGNQNNVHFLLLPDSLEYFNLRKSSETNYGDFLFEAGLQYQFNLGKERTLTFGVTSKLPANVNTTRITTALLYLPGVVETPIDTLQLRDTVDFETELPLGIGGGVFYRSSDRFSVGIDFFYRKWSEFARGAVVTDPLEDSWQVSAGGSFQPSELNDNVSYLRKITYRVGTKFAQPYWGFSESPYRQVSVSAGLSFPVVRTLSVIHLSVEAGKTLGGEPVDLQQQFVRGTLGLSLSDKWFNQRRID